MKIKTHLKLAKLSLVKCNYTASREVLSLPFFYLGVILADMSWLSKTRPHYASRSLPYIEHKIKKLKTVKFNSYHSLQLGIVVHYLCDFCCIAHQGGSVGNLKEHIRYERALNAYLKEQFPILREAYTESQVIEILDQHSPTHFLEFLHEHLHDYRSGKGSLHWDIEMATLLNARLCGMLLI